jgi:hypothetical protein
MTKEHVPQTAKTKQIIVMVLWLMTPTAAFSGISYGLGEAALRRVATPAN